MYAIQLYGFEINCAPKKNENEHAFGETKMKKKISAIPFVVTTAAAVPFSLSILDSVFFFFLFSLDSTFVFFFT